MVRRSYASSIWRLPAHLFLLIVSHLWTSPTYGTSLPWSNDLQLAVSEAREGRLHASLSALAELHANYPTETRIRHDYAVVAAWAREDALAAELLEDVNLAVIPTYVLQEYAKSLRNLKRFDDASAAYEMWLARQPNHFIAQVGAVLNDTDAGRFTHARAIFEQIDSTTLSEQQQRTYYLACGYLYERQRAFIGALDCYNLGLRLNPDNAELLQRRAIVASALGASQFAREELARTPAEIFATNQVSLEANALDVRWMQLEEPVARYEAGADVLDAFERLSDLTPVQQRTRHFDRLIAQVNGFQIDGAVAAFEQLRQTEPSLDPFPSYVLEAMGKAYLHVERPDDAVEMFQSAIANLGTNASEEALFDLRVGLFTALFDAGRFVEAYGLGEELEQAQSAWIRPNQRLWLENERYITARQTGALANAYLDRYDPALDSFESMLAIAPANHSLRLSSAIIKRWRGWTRQSYAEMERVQDERYIYPRTVLEGQLAIDSQDYERAQHAADKAAGLHPRGKATIDLRKRLAIHRRPELSIRSGFSQSDGNQEGSESFYIDARLSTGILGDHWQPFVHSYYRQADFVEGRGRDHRIGAGVAYYAPFWSATAEVHQGIEQNTDVGATFTHHWRSTDYLSHNTSLGLNSIEVPLRGSRVGVTGDVVSHDTTLHWHEAASLTGRVSYGDFDDDNKRKSAALEYQHRLLNWTYHKLYALGSAYTSRNSLGNAAYFNPSRDHDIRAGLMHEWRLHHDFALRRSIRTQLWLGRYHQQRFGSGRVWSAAVEYAQSINDVFDFALGLRFGRRPYDGEQERSEALFLTLRARP